MQECKIYLFKTFVVALSLRLSNEEAETIRWFFEILKT